MKAKSHWKQIPVRFLKCQQASRINLNAELHRLWDGVVVMRLGEEFRRVAGKEARELWPRVSAVQWPHLLPLSGGDSENECERLGCTETVTWQNRKKEVRRGWGVEEEGDNYDSS